MSNLERLYLRLPRMLQNLAVSYEGWRIQRRRYGREFTAVEDLVQKQAKLCKDDLEDLRNSLMRSFLTVASSSLFWKNRFAQCGLSLDAKDPFLELAKLPLLTKSEVKNNLDLIVNPIIDRKSLIWRHTSGTTGSGLVFPEVASTEHFTWAFWWRYRRMHGIVPSMRCGYFGGRSLVPLSVTQPPFWRYNHPGNQLMLSCYHLNHKTARDYLEALVDYDVQWLHGYPSILSLLSRYIQEQNLEVSLPRLRIITTGAENLTLAQRNSIAEVFNVPVVQHYGQAEAVANISECSHGALHVDEDFSCVEFVENPTDPGTCRLVGTNWLNPAFPLFRYDTGDVVVMGAGSCPCGNSGRLIHSIDGRMEDYLVLPNGTRIDRSARSYI